MSSRTQHILADGSSLEDAHPRVTIDKRDDRDRWRYACPNGHSDWGPTNSHLWCRGCQRQAEHGADVDPEHYAILDKKTGEAIPYSAVEVVGR